MNWIDIELMPPGLINEMVIFFPNLKEIAIEHVEKYVSTDSTQLQLVVLYNSSHTFDTK